MDDLLRSIFWHADKQFRRHDGFPVILWVTEDSRGRRMLWDRWCEVSVSVASDAEVLTALTREMTEEFAARGIVRFAIAYLANRATVVPPVDPDLPMQPTTTKRKGVVIELHSPTEHVGVFREIIRLPGRAPTLAAAETFDGSVAASPYANVLNQQECSAATDQRLGQQQ